ncbi:hypothetical protein HDV01_000278 [Terramyces sp. JEL0728]|nr:hypothetical protein HDV01_000278 [Terramyces sp. JEL0728]
MPANLEYTELNVQLYNYQAESKTVTIRNTTATPRIFKVKTTAPEVILASPRIAVIESGKTLSIKFSFVHLDTLDISKSQKILVQSVALDKLVVRDSSEQLLQYWKQLNPASPQSMKFKVTFEQANANLTQIRSVSPLNHVLTAQSTIPTKQKFSLKRISKWFSPVEV